MMKLSQITCISMLAVCCAACSGGGIDISIDPPPPPPAQPQVTVEGQMKQLVFSWAAVTGADHYRLMENADGHSGFTQVGDSIPSGTLSVSRDIAIHLFDWVNAQYVVEACNVTGCSDSDVVTATDTMLDSIGYFKATNTDANDWYGTSVDVSADGSTIAVNAFGEDSGASGINGDQADNSVDFAGAVYVLHNDASEWAQQAYIKSPFPVSYDYFFGWDLALSGDGKTLAATQVYEDGESTDIYIFKYDDIGWSYQTGFSYRCELNNLPDRCGYAPYVHDIDLSRDGNTLVVGDPLSPNGNGLGAIYVFRFDGSEWYRQAEIISNLPGHNFGAELALSDDGTVLAAQNHQRGEKPAVELFEFDGIVWSPMGHVKASSASDVYDCCSFGHSIALSADGSIIAIGDGHDDSDAVGIGGNPNNILAPASGAVYVYRFDGSQWVHDAYVKASNSEEGDYFGGSLDMSADGTMLAIYAAGEISSATGINGDQGDNSGENPGAVYVFRNDGALWKQESYVKFPRTDSIRPRPGYPNSEKPRDPIGLSADGTTLAVGRWLDDSSATGINGDLTDNSSTNSGAVFVY